MSSPFFTSAPFTVLNGGAGPKIHTLDQMPGYDTPGGYVDMQIGSTATAKSMYHSLFGGCEFGLAAGAKGAIPALYSPIIAPADLSRSVLQPWTAHVGPMRAIMLALDNNDGGA